MDTYVPNGGLEKAPIKNAIQGTTHQIIQSAKCWSNVPLFRPRLGSQIQGVAGCDVDEKLRRRIEGYNRRMEQEIAGKFGPGAHDAIQREARKRSGGVGP